MKIGFNTSDIDIIPLLQKIDLFLAEGCTALEIGMMSLEREKQLTPDLDKVPWDKFSYHSLHAPVIDFIYRDDEVTHSLLSRIEKLHEKYNFDLIVFHPNIVEDFNIFQKYNFPLAFENMDSRKTIATDVEGMKKIFALVDAKMVLDLNHCYTVDPSMNLAREFYENFKDRISEIHLSGFETFHDPLYKTEQLEIIQAIPDKNLPIIIEAGQNSVEDIKNEFNYIIKNLNK